MRRGAFATPTLIPATKIGRKSIRFFTPTAERKEGFFLLKSTLIYFFFSVVYLGSYSLGLVTDIRFLNNPIGDLTAIKLNQICNLISVRTFAAVFSFSVDLMYQPKSSQRVHC